MARLRIPVTPLDHSQGDANAPVTLVEYGDYECPHCALAHPIIRQVQEHYGRQLRFIYRNFPLAQVHPNAETAAETAEFAGEHGRFWDMHDAIYENQKQLSEGFLFELAAHLGLSALELRSALQTHQYLPRIRNDFMGGVRSGVNGTPTFFINDERHQAAYQYADLVAAIDARLPAKRRVS